MRSRDETRLCEELNFTGERKRDERKTRWRGGHGRMIDLSMRWSSDPEGGYAKVEPPVTRSLTTSARRRKILRNLS